MLPPQNIHGSVMPRPPSPGGSAMPRSPGGSMMPRSPGPGGSMMPRSPGPGGSMMPRPPGPGGSMMPRSPGGSMMPRSPGGSMMPRSPGGSMMPRSPGGSMMPRSPGGSMMPRPLSPGGSMMPRSPGGSMMPRPPGPGGSMMPRSPGPGGSMMPRPPGPGGSMMPRPRGPGVSMMHRTPTALLPPGSQLRLGSPISGSVGGTPRKFISQATASPKAPSSRRPFALPSEQLVPSPRGPPVSPSGASMALRPFRKSFALSQQPASLETYHSSLLKKQSSQSSEIPPVEEEESDESEIPGISKQGSGAPDELVVLESKEEESGRKKKKRKHKRHKTSSPGVSESAPDEIYMVPYKQKSQLDVWLPFVDRGTMYSAYYPRLGYRSTFGGRCYTSPISSALTTMHSSLPDSSVPFSRIGLPFPVMRRSYFLPSNGFGTIPVQARAAHPLFAPPFAYHYDRTGIMQSSPAATAQIEDLDASVSSHSSPRKGVTRKRKTSSRSTQSEIDASERNDIQTLAAALRTDPAVAGRSFAQMENIMAVQSQQIGMLVSSVQHLQYQVEVQGRELRSALQKKRELETQLAVARRSRVADKSVLDELLRRAERRLAAAVSTGERLGLAPAPLDRQAGSFFGAPVATGTVAVFPGQTVSPKKEKRLKKKRRESSSDSSSSSYRSSSPSTSSENRESGHSRRRPRSSTHSVQRQKVSGSTNSSSHRASRIGSKRSIGPFDDSIPTELQTVLVRPCCPENGRKSRFVVIGDGGPVDVVDIEAVVAENTKLHEVIGVLGKRLSAAIAESQVMATTQSKAREQLDIALFERHGEGLLRMENSRLKEELEIEKGKVNNLRTSAALAKIEAKREERILSSESTEEGSERRQPSIPKIVTHRAKPLRAVERMEDPRPKWGADPTQKWGADPTQKWGADPRQKWGADPTQKWGADPRQKWGGDPTQKWGGDPRQKWGGEPMQKWGGEPMQKLGGEPMQKWGGEPRQKWEEEAEQKWEEEAEQKWAEERIEKPVNEISSPPSEPIRTSGTRSFGTQKSLPLEATKSTRQISTEIKPDDLESESKRQQKEVEEMFEKALARQLSLKETDIKLLNDTLTSNQQLTAELVKMCQKSSQRLMNILGQTSPLLGGILARSGVTLTSLHLPPFRESPSADPLRSVGDCHEQLEEAVLQLERSIRQAVRESEIVSAASASEVSMRISQLEAELEVERGQAKEIEAKYSADVQRHLERVEEQARFLSKASQEIDVLRKRAVRAVDADNLESELAQIKAARDAAEARIEVLIKTIQDNTNDFNKRLEVGRRHFEQMVGERDVLRREFDDLQMDRTQLMSDLKATAELLRKAEVTIMDLSPENRNRYIDVLALRAKSTDAQIAVVNQQLEEMKKQQAGTDRIRNELKEQLEEARARVKKLEDMFKQASRELDSKAQQLGEERAEKMAREVLYKETKLRNDFIENELKMHVKTIEEKDAKIEEVMENRERFKEALHVVGDKFKALERRLEETETLLSKEKSTSVRLEGCMEKQKLINEKLKDDIEHLEKEKKAMQELQERGDLILMRRAAELQETTIRLEKKTDEVKELTTKAIELEREMNELKERLEDKNRSGSMMEERMSFTERQRDMGDKRFDNIRDELENTYKQLATAKHEAEETRRILDTSRVSELHAISKYELAEDEMRRLRSEISRLNTSLRERSFEVDDLKSRIGIMESSQKVIIHEAAKSKEQVVKVEGGLADFGDRMDEVLKKKDEALAQMSHLRKQRESEWRTVYSKLKEEFQSLRNEFNTLVDNLNAAGVNVANYLPSKLIETKQESTPKQESSSTEDVHTPLELASELFEQPEGRVPSNELSPLRAEESPVTPKFSPRRKSRSSPLKERSLSPAKKSPPSKPSLSPSKPSLSPSKPSPPKSPSEISLPVQTSKKSLPAKQGNASNLNIPTIPPVSPPAKEESSEQQNILPETTEVSAIHSIPQELTLHLQSLGFPHHFMEPPRVLPGWWDSIPLQLPTPKEVQLPTPKDVQRRYQVEGRLRLQQTRIRGRVPQVCQHLSSPVYCCDSRGLNDTSSSDSDNHFCNSRGARGKHYCHQNSPIAVECPIAMECQAEIKRINRIS